jgi:ADP-ribosylglycohydrolase/protein-tyrosine phosphatase
VTETRTSAASPIEVGWIVPGRVGLTLAPGKRAPSALGAPWERDLQSDLVRLATLGTSTLVSLVEEHELRALGIPDLLHVARALTIVVERFPIPDGAAPQDLAEVRRLVDSIVDRADRGEVVVIHCRGGLGRSGTIGGAVLVAMGHSVEEAFAILAEARGPRCPENDLQRDFVRRFAEDVRARPVVRARAAEAEAALGLGRRAERFAGAVLGAAIGDALGHPTEFVGSFEALRERFGPNGVDGFVLFRERAGRRFAPYTDDTQMAELVLRGLVTARAAGDDLDGTMRRIARELVAWSIRPQGGHRAPGRACLMGCRALELGADWRSAGEADAGGCGSVMRAYPFGLLFADDVAQAEAWAAAHSRLTHGDPIALAACAALAAGVALALRDEHVERILEAMVAAAARLSEPTADMMRLAIDEAASGVGPEVTLDRLRGWAAHEAIAAAAYVFARHPDDARAALLEAANTPGDSDSIATLVGALSGARLGLAGLDAAWVAQLERSAELLGLALAAAGCAVPSVAPP